MKAARHPSSDQTLGASRPRPKLSTAGRPAWVEVDLEFLAHNFGVLRDRAGERQLAAVVKADAYGHGAVAVSRILEREGVEWLAVAFVEEGIELRESGIAAPILVFGGYARSELPLFREFGLTAAVSSQEQLDVWIQACGAGSRDSSQSGKASGELRLQNWTQSIHLKVDTGMARLGFSATDVESAVEKIGACPGLKLAGIFSHLCHADKPDDEISVSRTLAQRSKFDAILAKLAPSVVSDLSIHLESSASLLHHELNRGFLVRCGLALYGIDPAGRPTRSDRSDRSGAGVLLRPVMRVISRLVQVRSVPKGTPTGYGGTWTAPRKSSLAVVPVGYADGYRRSLANRAEVLIRGSRASVVGAVSMDMVVVDVTACRGEVGDEVVLLGKQGESEISVYELSELAATIPYELLAGFGLRLPKRYRSGSEKTAEI